MNTICYLCKHDKYKVVFTENEIPIVQCDNCGHIFSTYQQELHYDGYWNDGENVYDLNWWDLAHRRIYSDFIDRFVQKESGTILDVGCGLGFFLKTIQSKRSNWNIIGYEISKQAVEFANTKNQIPTIYAGRVELSGIKPNSIDIITLWDVIEHIPEPQPLLNYLHSLLKPDGFLFVQTPNVVVQLWKAKLKVALKGMKPNVHYLEAKDHINDYSRKTLSKLAEQCNFKVEQFYILPPILSVSGSNNSFFRFLKLTYFYITNWLWKLSGNTIFLNNTLFAIFIKKK